MKILYKVDSNKEISPLEILNIIETNSKKNLTNLKAQKRNKKREK